MDTTLRRAAAVPAVALLSAGALALGAAPASAHAELTPSTTVAGEYAVLTFAIGHGCDASPTTKVAIEIPEGVDVVTPTINDGWQVTKQTEPLPDAGSDQEESNERVTRVTYTADRPLADGYRDTFDLSVPLPDEPGETLAFPTVQTCKQGRIAWSQMPEDGQSADDLESPAPTMELTSGEDDGDEAGAAEPAEASDSGDGDGDGASWTAMGVGVAGLAVGGVALARTRSRD